MRLLFCNLCKTLEECPDYEGPLEIDPILEDLVRRHNERDPMGHGGRDLRASPMRVAVIAPTEHKTSDEVWETDRENVLKQLNEENKKVGHASWAYEALNTYAEDAMKCYNRHRRPDLGNGKPCIDYWSESKRIGRPSVMGRTMLKIAPKKGTSDPHLCQWCPYYSTVSTEVRWRAGMYRDN